MRSSCSGVALSPARIAAGSPGRQPQQQKHEQRHHAHHGNGGQYAAKQVSEHRDVYTSEMVNTFRARL